MRNRHQLHHTKLKDFLEWVSTNKGYDILETKGDYEAFRIKKNSILVIGHKRNKSNHITIHNQGLFLVSEWIKSRDLK